ncbi:hypothetical protein NPIL_136511 [Nephila pilipes]|uniref:Uncharacterized protein n=1 Tax=Nephila pilipes TaxID=299642 RepID=A0A8X6MDH8_NEPPI|nr:hypothetical protein NPIL_136511 [Nephila pilipes]
MRPGSPDDQPDETPDLSSTFCLTWFSNNCGVQHQLHSSVTFILKTILAPVCGWRIDNIPVPMSMPFIFPWKGF